MSHGSWFSNSQLSDINAAVYEIMTKNVSQAHFLANQHDFGIESRPTELKLNYILRKV